jgi:hypothetical protein
MAFEQNQNPPERPFGPTAAQLATRRLASEAAGLLGAYSPLNSPLNNLLSVLPAVGVTDMHNQISAGIAAGNDQRIRRFGQFALPQLLEASTSGTGAQRAFATELLYHFANLFESGGDRGMIFPILDRFINSLNPDQRAEFGRLATDFVPGNAPRLDHFRAAQRGHQMADFLQRHGAPQLAALAHTDRILSIQNMISQPGAPPLTAEEAGALLRYAEYLNTNHQHNPYAVALVAQIHRLTDQ